MESISIEDFSKRFIKDNPESTLEDIKRKLKDAVKRKNRGEGCMVCGQPIWAIGTAITGSAMCFSCTTGEADSSGDYEIDQVVEL